MIWETALCSMVTSQKPHAVDSHCAADTVSRCAHSIYSPPQLWCSAGEVFGGLAIPAGGNDTQAVLQALTHTSVKDVFNCLRGPWAAVYWHQGSRTLWFGKDVLGVLQQLCCNT